MLKLFAASVALCGASWFGGGLAAGEPDAARERARAALALARAAYPAQAPAVRGPDQAPPVRTTCGCDGPETCSCPLGKCECPACLEAYQKARAAALEESGYLAVWVNGKAEPIEGVYTATFTKPGESPSINVYKCSKGHRRLLKRLRGRCSARDVLVAVEADQLAAEMRREARRRAARPVRFLPPVAAGPMMGGGGRGGGC
jgi:hypothetical protein